MSAVHRGVVVRLKPTPEQAERLSSWVGAVRYVYNLALEQRETYTRPGRRFNYVSVSREVTALRAESEWIADLPRNTLNYAAADLDRAYVNWWSGKAKRPTWRRSGLNDSFRLGAVDLSIRRTGRGSGRLKLPKLGSIPFRWAGSLEGEVRSVTVARRAGQWFASLLFERAAAPAEMMASVVGIDRGIAVFAALSTGEMIAGPHVGRHASAALAKAQRSLSRKVKGSSNRRKARLRVARLHKRVADARKDFLHKVSTAIAKSHGVVVLEDLNIGSMTASASGTAEVPGRNVRQKAGLIRAILDQGWGMFRTMLAYKLEERGGHLVTVDPRNTSRTCAVCGVVDADSREGVRFSCRSCGHEAHADTNAAINILRRRAPITPVEVVSAAFEAGTARGDPGSSETSGRENSPRREQ